MGDPLPPPSPSASPPGTPTARRAGGRPGSRRARGARAAAAMVAVVVVAAVVVAVARGGDGTNSGGVRIGLLEADGDYVIVDGSGDETGRVELGLEDVRSLASGSAGRLWAGVHGNGTLTVLDIESGETSETPLAGAASGAGVRRLVSDVPMLAVGPPAGGNVWVATPTGVIDLAEASGIEDPLFLLEGVLPTPEGDGVVAFEAGSSAVVYVPTDRAVDALVYDASGLVALSDELLVVQRRAGDDGGELLLVDLDDRDERLVPTPGVAGALVRGDGSLLAVTVEGELATIAPDDDELEMTGVTIDGAVRAFAAPTADRLLVVTGDAMALVDGTGNVLAELPGERPLTPLLDPGRRCVATVADGELRLFDLETGDALGEPVGDIRPGRVIPTSADGCALLVHRGEGRPEALAIDGGQVINLGGAEVIGVAAGADVFLVRDGARVWLRPLEDPDATGVELPADRPLRVHDHVM